MAGGLLNLVSEGSMNAFLTGNPSITFFKTKYKQYTNFGLQKFRLDFKGQRSLRLTEDSTFTFKVPRYADLLMDTFMCIRLPHIWSPIREVTDGSGNSCCVPYEFKWISNIGTAMIRNIRFLAGGQVIQEFGGDYQLAMKERDFDGTKRELYNTMTGNVPELYDPSYPTSAGQRLYPSVIPTVPNPAPSILGRLLYVPLNIWFTMAAKMAYPLISTQYCELEIEITLRPINELFTLNFPSSDKNVALAPNFTKPDQALRLFLQPPKATPGEQGCSSEITVRPADYPGDLVNWDADLHLIATYAFLSKDEASQFAAKPQRYLTTQVHTTIFNDVVQTAKLRLFSLGMVKAYMWFLRRSDVKLRNQWANFTNKNYEDAPRLSLNSCNAKDASCGMDSKSVEFGYCPLPFSQEDCPEIMKRWFLDLGGKAREDPLDEGVLSYVEQYARSSGSAKPGLYFYNFCLNTSPTVFQPTGGINMSKFNKIEMGLETVNPPLVESLGVSVVCNGNQQEIGTVKNVDDLYQYSYDLILFEERYNVLSIENGMAGLMYAR